MHHRNGFTLVELMISMAVLIIVSAYTISNASGWAQRMKQSEAAAVVGGLVEAQLAHESSDDAFVACGVQPRPIAALDREAVHWPRRPEGFRSLGWSPSDPVRGAYFCERAPARGVELVCAGVIDSDADGRADVYARVVSAPGRRGLAASADLATDVGDALLGLLVPPAHAAHAGPARRSSRVGRAGRLHELEIEGLPIRGANARSVTAQVLRAL